MRITEAITKAIEIKEEFFFLDAYKNENHLGNLEEKEINYVLDRYNFYMKDKEYENDNYACKWFAMSDLIKYIGNENERKHKRRNLYS